MAWNFDVVNKSIFLGQKFDIVGVNFHQHILGVFELSRIFKIWPKYWQFCKIQLFWTKYSEKNSGDQNPLKVPKKVFSIARIEFMALLQTFANDLIFRLFWYFLQIL